MTTQIDDMTPVIIGVGQFQMDVPDGFNNALGPIEMTVKAVEAAFKDSGVNALVKNIDRLTAIRTFADSGPLFTCPFGSSKNMPRSIASRIGADPKVAIYSSIGGEQPQTQLYKTAKALREGESKLAVICGGEAMATMKAAMRASVKLDWSDQPENSDIEDEGLFPDGMPLHSEEMRHGLMTPIQFYAMMETARRLDLGLSVEAYRQKMGQLFEPFAARASENPVAMFKEKKTAKTIAEVSPFNPVLAEPYTKAMIAKDGVNQAAAIIMTTREQALAWGIDPSKFIYLQGFSKTTEKHLIERADPSRSPALMRALEGAMCCAGLKTKDISHADLYSCFPIVVFRSQELMKEAGLDKVTLTGGLPFFGGPGNNYTLHAIAEMVETLRRHPNDYGLVQGNGGFMSKHSVGVYSAQKPQFDMFDRVVDLQTDLEGVPNIDLDTQCKGNAALLSYCLSYKKRVPDNAIILLKLESNRHALARFEGDLTCLNDLKKGASFSVNTSPRGNVAVLA